MFDVVHIEGERLVNFEDVQMVSNSDTGILINPTFTLVDVKGNLCLMGSIQYFCCLIPVADVLLFWCPRWIYLHTKEKHMHIHACVYAEKICRLMHAMG